MTKVTEKLRRVKVLGYTTDYNKCECCGKENLAGTIALLDKDHDHVLHYGTTCAGKAEKYDNLAISTYKIGLSIKKAKKKYEENYKFCLSWCKEKCIELGIDISELEKMAKDFYKFQFEEKKNCLDFNYQIYKRGN